MNAVLSFASFEGLMLPCECAKEKMSSSATATLRKWDGLTIFPVKAFRKLDHYHAAALRQPVNCQPSRVINNFFSRVWCDVNHLIVDESHYLFDEQGVRCNFRFPVRRSVAFLGIYEWYFRYFCGITQHFKFTGHHLGGRKMGLRTLLFHGGYCAAAAQAYFGQLEFLTSQADDPANPAKYLENLKEKLKGEHSDCEANLTTALQMAVQVEVKVDACGSEPHAFRDWFWQFVEAVEARFPMNRIDHYYFLFGRKMSEISSNTTIAAALLRARGYANSSDTAYRIEKCLRDCEYSLFKLTAPSALLAGEPRQGHFGTIYRRMNQEFAPFRNASMGAHSKMSDDETAGRLEKYGLARKGEFSDCKAILEELGI
jgi:hypothetical protein